MKIQTLLEISNQELMATEDELDRMFREIGLDVEFSQHFRNRVLDKDGAGRADFLGNSNARDTDVSQEEITKIFRQMKDRYGKQLLHARKNPEQFTALLKDITTELNIPFAIDYERVFKKVHELKAITLMRKKNFTSSNKRDKVFTVKTGAED